MNVYILCQTGETQEECGTCGKTYVGGEGRLCNNCHPASVRSSGHESDESGPTSHPDDEEQHSS